MGVSKHMGASKHRDTLTYRGIQTYREVCGGIQSYRGIQTYGGIQIYRGHPNIWGIPIYRGAFKHMKASKVMGASKCMGAYGHPLSLTKHVFFVLCMYRGHPNIWGTPTSGCPLNICGHSHMFGCPPCLDAPICLEDVWMPPVHTQHKGCMLCHTKGCPYALYIRMPICLDGPLYV